jgi:hypothetical protein
MERHIDDSPRSASLSPKERPKDSLSVILEQTRRPYGKLPDTARPLQHGKAHQAPQNRP